MRMRLNRALHLVQNPSVISLNQISARSLIHTKIQVIWGRLGELGLCKNGADRFCYRRRELVEVSTGAGHKIKNAGVFDS